jgi:hypothetical protein
MDKTWTRYGLVFSPRCVFGDGWFYCTQHNCILLNSLVKYHLCMPLSWFLKFLAYNVSRVNLHCYIDTQHFQNYQLMHKWITKQIWHQASFSFLFHVLKSHNRKVKTLFTHLSNKTLKHKIRKLMGWWLNNIAHFETSKRWNSC